MTMLPSVEHDPMTAVVLTPCARAALAAAHALIMCEQTSHGPRYRIVWRLVPDALVIAEIESPDGRYEVGLRCATDAPFEHEIA